MPQIQPINAICFAKGFALPDAPSDISSLIAPPYDVLDETSKQKLLAADPRNIVAIDLPFTPPKVVGPDAVYEQAGKTFQNWLSAGILTRRPKPAIYIYEQVYRHNDRDFKRCGLIVNVRLQQPGQTTDADSSAGIWAHEKTFSGGTTDRLKLTSACHAQLSPIFGLYSDPEQLIANTLCNTIQNKKPTFQGTTLSDSVQHNVWEISDPATIQAFSKPLSLAHLYIADGHHRYHTALNYRDQVAASQQNNLPPDHPANFCMFVLVAKEDPGMIVLPTHRVIGGLAGLTLDAFQKASNGLLHLTPFQGGNGNIEQDLAALEKTLPSAGPHAIGIYLPSEPNTPLWIATTCNSDPLATTHPNQSPDWRNLDVAIVQHLIVEQICQPQFCPPDQKPNWKFPHTLSQLLIDAQSPGYQLGLILQPTPLDSVMKVSRTGELMPQKSTFFYPKLATGLIMNPLANNAV